MTGLSSISPTAWKVYRLLEHAANEGERCPSNDAIAEAVHASSPSRGTYLLDRLEGAGVISVERGNNRRIVTITETGKRTAGEISKPHWRDRPERPAIVARGRNQRNKHMTEEVILSRRTVRDPCTFCGVRPEVGCRHSRKDAVGEPVKTFVHGIATNRAALPLVDQPKVES